MISFTIFISLLIVAIVGFAFKAITKKSWFIKTSIASGIGAIVIFIAACIIPYCLQQRDLVAIAFAEKNIELYNSQIDKYTEAAQKQISDYQAAQSQLARNATSIQLQFYSQQIDTVGNKLTDQIKIYSDKILDWEIEINKAEAKIEFRPKNKWVFGL